MSPVSDPSDQSTAPAEPAAGTVRTAAGPRPGESSRRSVWRRRALRAAIAGGTIVVGAYTAIYIYWSGAGQHKDALAALATRRFGATVTIDTLKTGWHGWQPVFTAEHLALLDPSGMPQLRVQRVEGAVSWRSLFALAPRLDWLTVDAAHAVLERDRAGVIRLAGVALNTQASQDADVPDWLMSTNSAALFKLDVVWRDAQTGAPPLTVSVPELTLARDGQRHTAQLQLATAMLDAPLRLQARFSHGLWSRPGHWRSWTGDADWHLPETDLTQLNRYLPFAAHLDAGRVSGEGRLAFHEGAIERANLALVMDVDKLRVRSQLATLTLRHAGGRLAYAVGDGLRHATVSDLRWQDERGSHGLKQMQIDWQDAEPATAASTMPAAAEDSPAMPRRASVKATTLQVEPIAHLLLGLPLPAQAHRWLQAARPEGDIDDFQAGWQAPEQGMSFARFARLWRAKSVEKLAERSAEKSAEKSSGTSADPPDAKPTDGKTAEAAPIRYTVRATLRGVGIASINRDAGGIMLPGVQRLSGRLDADQDHGSLQVDSSDLSLHAPGLFESALRFERVAGGIEWKWRGDAINIEARELLVANGDLDGKLSGGYQHGGAGDKSAGRLALHGRFAHVALDRAVRYVPVTVPADTRQFLRLGLTGGRAQEIAIDFNGAIDEFPFAHTGSQGQFRISALLRGASLRPNAGPARMWPVIDDVDGRLDIDERSLRFDIARGRVDTVTIDSAKGRIADVYGSDAMLDMDIAANGPTDAFLRYVRNSPLETMLPPLASADLQAQGAARLKLNATLPLARDAGRQKLSGSVTLVDNMLALGADQPALTGVRGEIRFSESGFELRDLRARLFGGDLRIGGGSQADGTVQIGFGGNLTIGGLAELGGADGPARIGRYLRGGTAYQGSLRTRRGGTELIVQSDLRGIESTLPWPLDKPAQGPIPARIEWRQPGGGRREEIHAQIGNDIGLHYELERTPRGPRIVRGGIGVGQPVPEPDSGVLANIAGQAIDIDAWRTALGELGAPSAAEATREQATGGLASAMLPSNLAIQFDEVRIFNRVVRDVVAGISRDGRNWQANIAAPDISGYLRWRPESRAVPFGELTARLARLSIPQAADEELSRAVATGTQEIPSIDLVAEDFNLHGMALGKLEVKARSTMRDGESEWEMSELRISQPAASLIASGNWRFPRRLGDAGVKRTALNFRLNVADAGALLRNLGMPRTLDGGYGKLEGRLQWHGNPLSIDYPSLNGLVAIDLQKGRFLKVDPGIAKLLGVLSLQGLTRFAILDLRGLTSEGLQFDGVTATAEVDSGVARTQDFLITSPVTTVNMRGEADMQQETQDLVVDVRPIVNAGSASLAYALINPALGLGSLLAQVLLGDSISEALRQQYTITGPWAEPKIERTDPNARKMRDKGEKK